METANTEKSTGWLKLFNTVGFLLTIAVNALANILPINGKTTGEIADAYPNLFTPSALTFTIWIVIYLALALFVIYQLGLTRDKPMSDIAVREIGWLFVICSLANSAWILFWHYNQIGITVLCMLVLLLSLCLIYRRVYNVCETTLQYRLFVQAPFSIYLGWICVATIANISTFLISIGWDGFGLSDQGWAIIAIALAVLLTAFFIIRNKDILFSMVVLWALAGILIKHITYYDAQYQGVLISIGVGAVVIIVLSLVNFKQWKLLGE